MKKLFLLFLFISFESFTQPSEILNSAELQIALDKLNTLGSVLFIAAHPDDENTAVLSYFAAEKKFRTGYLSMTRGDGGQNLIGSEQAELLGVIRTNELLEARKIDNAEQFFTRAVDFGYSKTADETLEIWDKQKILSDVVWVFRNFKPDVVINRFPSSSEGGHGHHTASALIAEEAFYLAGDKKAFPEQLKYVDVWQPKRLYWNAWMPLLEQRKTDISKLISINLGEYNPQLGKSYSEISALSRTMHKSQGFGSSGRRGETLNYFTYVAGDSADTDLFDDINTSWSRVNNSSEAEKLLSEARKNFNPSKPYEILPILLDAYKAMDKIENEYWKILKKKELEKVIQSCAGIWIEAVGEDYSASPGDDIKLTAGIVSRSPFPFKIKRLQISALKNIELNKDLKQGEFFDIPVEITLPDDFPITRHYWLKDNPLKGSFVVDDPALIGMAESEPSVSAEFNIEASGVEVSLSTPLYYRWTDPVEGEKYRPFIAAPKVTINFEQNVFLFNTGDEKKINVTVKSHTNDTAGKIKLQAPEGWKIFPDQKEFSLSKKYEEHVLSFSIIPPKENSGGQITASAFIDGKELSESIKIISYNHIPVQTVFSDASAKLIRMNFNTDVKNIGYIAGSGDDIPVILSQLGFNVTLLTDEQLENDDLSKYDAVAAGIRAFNTRDRLQISNKRILEYVEEGGTYIVQYNTNRGLPDNIGPYPFTVSRDRVTDEEAPVQILNESHPLISSPNKITEEDFDSWIQERGLYFPGDWDEKYQTVISMNDPNEAPKKGSILFTRYGKGAFIYTGLSFFRQLPAGVPGAIKLFINLLSAGNISG